MKRTLWLLLFLLIPAMVAAQTTELLISEYIEGSSNNKALELYNGTGASINLATGNYVVQMYFNGSSTPGLTIALTGSVAPGDVHVLAHSSASATILAQADQTNGSGWFNGDDALVLRKGGGSGTIIDAIGDVGFDPGTEWGTGLVSTADNTLRRRASACTGDVTVSDDFEPASSFDGYAIDTFDGLGSHLANCQSGDAAPMVTSSTPAAGSTGVASDANILITFSEDVIVVGTWFDIRDANNTAVAASVSGGPRTFTLDPTSDLAEGMTYTVTIMASQVNDQDANDPPDLMSASHSFSFTTGSVVRISTVQGSGATSLMAGQTVTIEGIVVGDFQANDGNTSNLDGFYLQEESADYDNNPATSEGIFVYAPGAAAVSVGDRVRVTGEVFELTGSGSSLTELRSVSNLSVRGTALVPTPVDIELPLSSRAFLERYEGMLVRFPQELVISEYFNFDRFGEIVLARPVNSLDRLYTPTSYVEPGAAAAAVAADNALRTIVLDDARSSQNPDPAIHPNGEEFTTGNLFRGGDIVENATGILDERFGLYRIQPTVGADYTAVNARTAEPEDVGGCLKIASFNVLNYFLTLNAGRNICGPGQNVECRGANTTEEFQRQRAKIIDALATINADIFGLIEMENTTGVEPLQDIVDGLNSRLGAGTYAYISTGVIGTDAIRNGIIYKPAVVTPQGDFALLTSAVDPRFIDTKNRPSLAQSFRENATGGVVTVVVNHFKSKGSDCNDLSDPDLGDGAGNCNITRTLAAEALVDWLAGDPTGSNDPDFLILGDLNSYDEEDPIDAVRDGADDIRGTADDFIDLVEREQGEFAYSYTFDAQIGYLDYAMASTSLAEQVTGATEWHINADEADLIDYDMSFKLPAQDALYEPNAYRSSDHDPIVVGLDIGAPVIEISAPAMELWPPNHNHRTIDISDLAIVADDACDSDVSTDDIRILEVYSDEAENGDNDGNTTDDIVIGDDCRSVALRAERQSNGNGRVYTIVLQAIDASGNTTTTDYKVSVPKSQGRNAAAVDDGRVYTEVADCNADRFERRTPRAIDGDPAIATTGEGRLTVIVRFIPGADNPLEILLELVRRRMFASI